MLKLVERRYQHDAINISTLHSKRPSPQEQMVPQSWSQRLMSRLRTDSKVGKSISTISNGDCDDDDGKRSSLPPFLISFLKFCGFTPTIRRAAPVDGQVRQRSKVEIIEDNSFKGI